MLAIGPHTRALAASTHSCSCSCQISRHESSQARLDSATRHDRPRTHLPRARPGHKSRHRVYWPAAQRQAPVALSPESRVPSPESCFLSPSDNILGQPAFAITIRHAQSPPRAARYPAKQTSAHTSITKVDVLLLGAPHPHSHCCERRSRSWSWSSRARPAAASRTQSSSRQDGQT